MRQIPRKIELVIFDLDGTLVDAYQAITDSINHMLKVMGLPGQTHRRVKRSVGLGVHRLIRCFVEESQAAEALDIFRKHHDVRLRQEIKLLPGVRTLLPFLKDQGCSLAVASNRPTPFCQLILKELRMDHYFDHVICADAVRRAKPYPDMLKVILRKSRVEPARAIYVGDMVVDICCGQRAGVFVVGVSTGSCTRREILEARPDLWLPRIGALRSLFVKGKA